MRKKSKNLQGKLSVAMKANLAWIKEGITLLVARSEAGGDPQYLRMRNNELSTKEVERENVGLKEQVRRTSPGAASPPYKRKVEKLAMANARFAVPNVPGNTSSKQQAPVGAPPEGGIPSSTPERGESWGDPEDNVSPFIWRRRHGRGHADITANKCSDRRMQSGTGKEVEGANGTGTRERTGRE